VAIGASVRTRRLGGWGTLVRLLSLAPLAAGSSTAAAYEPQTNYMLQCMGCHTPDGSGEPGRVPSIKETLVPFALTPAGRRFLIQVPGVSQSTLTDAELAELLNWMVRSLSVVKSDHLAPFTEAEVAGYRRTPLVDVQGTRQRLLESSKAEPSR